jgi:hypothetical protein
MADPTRMISGFGSTCHFQALRVVPSYSMNLGLKVILTPLMQLHLRYSNRSDATENLDHEMK